MTQLAYRAYCEKAAAHPGVIRKFNDRTGLPYLETVMRTERLVWYEDGPAHFKPGIPKQASIVHGLKAVIRFDDMNELGITEDPEFIVEANQ